MDQLLNLQTLGIILSAFKPEGSRGCPTFTDCAKVGLIRNAAPPWDQPWLRAAPADSRPAQQPAPARPCKPRIRPHPGSLLQTKTWPAGAPAPAPPVDQSPVPPPPGPRPGAP